MINEIEKKYVYIVFGIAIIIFIIVLFNIWSPMFKDKKIEKEINSSNFYEENYFSNKMSEEYKKIVSDAINVENYDKIKDKIDADYLKNININVENLKEYLIDNDILKHPSNSTIIYNVSIRSDGEKYIYSYKYRIGNDEKLIHIIEDYYGVYSISYAQDSYPVLTKKEYDLFDENGVEYKVKYNCCYEDSLVLDITIINDTTEELTYNFNGQQSSDVIYDGNIRSFLNNVVIGPDYSTIVTRPGSVTNIKLSYSVELSNQDKIQSIEFNDIVKTNGDKIAIKLELK